MASVLVGRFRGGLAHINVVSSMFFAGVTGSATADSSSIGAVLIPAMIKEGYEKDISVAVTATSSTIGILIPPSIPMVIYGILTDQSVGTLFIAGAVPGLLVGLILMIVNFLLARSRGYPREAAFTLRETLVAMVQGIPPLMTIVIILGGIMGGIVTPTEAAVTAVAYTFILGMFFYRKLTLRIIPRLMIETIRISGMVMLMLATATLFSWIITSQEVPMAIGNFLTETIDNPLLLLLVFNIVLLLAGAILDLTPAMIIFVPVLAPIAHSIGVDPIHFGVIVVMNLGIGLFTPPVGGVLFVSCSIAGINMKDIFRGLTPYFLGMIAALLLITYVPFFSLWLPGLVQ